MAQSVQGSDDVQQPRPSRPRGGFASGVGLMASGLLIGLLSFRLWIGTIPGSYGECIAFLGMFVGVVAFVGGAIIWAMLRPKPYS